MANHFCRNMFSHIRIRFLHSSNPPLPTTSATSSSSFTVDFLVNSCGLPLESALSVSNKFQLNHKTPQKPQSVLQFLKSHHFSDTQVARLIVKWPKVLNCRIDSNLKPKFDYLMEIGFEGELLPRTILSNTNIMTTSLASQIEPTVQFLRLFLDSDEKFLMVAKRAPFLFLGSNLRLKQNVELLMKEGVPALVVQRLLTLDPRSMFLNPGKFITAVNSVKDLGFEPTDTMFMQAFRVKIQLSDLTWNKKIEVMKSMGFSEDDTLKAFKRFPHCLACSEDNIRKTMNFYLNTMKLEPQTIIRSPGLLGYSIEKRVRPRYHVLKVLESKKLIKGNKKLHIVGIGEKKFREIYIDQFIDRVPGLLEFYLGIKEAKSFVLNGEEPRCIFQTPAKLISAVNSAKNLGFEPNDPMFFQAFRVVIQMSDSIWKKKIEVMKSMGFCEDDILKAFKRCPHCLACSEENIRMTLHFYLHTMKLEPQNIIGSPGLLGHSIEKRARPRYHVLKVLESKKLIKGNKKKLHILVTAEEKFREKYIDELIDEVLGLLEFYLGI